MTTSGNFSSHLARTLDDELTSDNLMEMSRPWESSTSPRHTNFDASAWSDGDYMTDDQFDRAQKIDEFFDAPEGTSSRTALSSRSTKLLAQNFGYMQQSSALKMDSTPSQLSFLEWYPVGAGTLTFPNDHNDHESIRNINLDIVADRCPLLAIAFEDSRSGPRLYLETLTSSTALPFLRFLYSGTYALKGACGDFYEDVPTSVLFHCQLFRLGDIYDLQDLRTQAYVNVLRQMEFGCSSPDKPIDLCDAIRFVYRYLSEQADLIDAIVNYCVSCFERHRLAEDNQFKQLAYDLRPFHQALCKNIMSREYESEAAAAIIKLPYKPFVPATYASRDDYANKRLDDIVYHFHSNDQMDSLPKKRKRPDDRAGTSSGEQISLPIRSLQTWAPAIPDVRVEDEVCGTEHKRRASTPSQPKAIEELRIQLEKQLENQLKEVARGQGWKLDVVDTPRGKKFEGTITHENSRKLGLHVDSGEGLDRDRNGGDDAKEFALLSRPQQTLTAASPPSTEEGFCNVPLDDECIDASSNGCSDEEFELVPTPPESEQAHESGAIGNAVAESDDEVGQWVDVPIPKSPGSDSDSGWSVV